jgi:hypothetical protein
MTPLIDGDMMLYECCFAAEYRKKDATDWEFPEFESIRNILDSKILEIKARLETEEDPIIFITDNKWLAERQERTFQPLFRFDVAVTKPYKHGRTSEKPFHFYNLLFYMMLNYNCSIVVDGLEADDALGIYQCQNEGTIICSRDKDLRQIPGLHYSWETGVNPSFGPHKAQGLGRIWYVKDKVYGLGWKWFFYQMLIGDPVDGIGGCKGVGEKKAFPLLVDANSIEEMYQIVQRTYKKVYGKEYWYTFQEMGELLFIRRDDKTFQEYWRTNFVV